MTAMNFAREIITPELIAEAAPLIQEHFNEVDSFPDIQMGLNEGFYLAIEARGIARLYSARVDGRLVGYALFIVSQHTHYLDSVQALQDMIYLAPEMRKGFNGVKFLRWCDEQLYNEGVDVAYHMGTDRKDISAVLKRIGYAPIQTMFARRFN